MNPALDALSAEDLVALARELAAARLRPPYEAVALRRCLPLADHAAIEAGLLALSSKGATAEVLALFFERLAVERRAAVRSRDALELVWTGPEVPQRASRSTAAVVRELFAGAETSVLVSGFVVYRGKEVFAPLAERMDQNPTLKARFFLNIARAPHQAEAPAAEVVRSFAETFQRHHWPGQRPPKLYYDPRSLEGGAGHGVLHAKCVVIDGVESLITSANFTEAAHHRNVEAGVRVRDLRLAAELTERFDELIRGGQLVNVAL